MGREGRECTRRGGGVCGGRGEGCGREGVCKESERVCEERGRVSDSQLVFHEVMILF